MSIAHVSRALYLPDMPNGEKVLLLALADAANQDGFAYPGRTRLSVACNCTERHVSSMVAKLVERGLIMVKTRGRKGNAYLVFPTAEGVADYGFLEGSGVPTGTTKGGSLDAQKGEVQDALRARTGEGEPSGEPPVDMSAQRPSGFVGVGTKFFGEKVTEAEFEKASAILEAFNELAETRFTLRTRDNLRMLVCRPREHPDLGLADYRRIIAASLADPWWDSSPNLNVIFSPKVFEVAMARAEPGAPRRADRAEQGHQNADDFREAARRMREVGLG